MLIFVIKCDHCEVVLRCFDLHFQGQIFQMQIYLKLIAKHPSYGFYIFWYLPLNGAMPMVVLCDVSLVFQGQIFQILLSRKRCELRKYVKFDFYIRWYLPSKSNNCENHTLRVFIFNKFVYVEQFKLFIYYIRKLIDAFHICLPSLLIFCFGCFITEPASFITAY